MIYKPDQKEFINTYRIHSTQLLRLLRSAEKAWYKFKTSSQSLLSLLTFAES